MQDLKEFFSRNDRFASHCGIELLEAGPGYARASMIIQPFHINGAGTVHGGAIFTLADFVFAAASNSHGQLALAVDTHISFIKAVYDGVIYGEAEELAASGRLGNYLVRLTDDKHRLIAQFQGTAYRKKDSFPPDSATS